MSKMPTPDLLTVTFKIDLIPDGIHRNTVKQLIKNGLYYMTVNNFISALAAFSSASSYVFAYQNTSKDTTVTPLLSGLLGYVESLQDKTKNLGSSEEKKDETDDWEKECLTANPLRTNELSLSFADVIGMKEEKQTFFEAICQPQIYPNLFQKSAKGILLYGPPGNGKTLLVKSAVKELSSRFKDVKTLFFALTGADLKGKYVGETEKKIVRAYTCAARAACLAMDPENDSANKKQDNIIEALAEFQRLKGVGGDPQITESTAKMTKQELSDFKADFNAVGDKAVFKKAPKYLSVLFIDEFESIGRDRSSDDSGLVANSVNTLLQMMDGINSFKNVITICATNYPWDLDSALLRRFNEQIYCKVPDAAGIKQLIIKENRDRLKINRKTLLNICANMVELNVRDEYAGFFKNAEVEQNAKFSLQNFIDTDYVDDNSPAMLGVISKLAEKYYSNSDVASVMQKAYNMVASTALKSSVWTIVNNAETKENYYVSQLTKLKPAARHQFSQALKSLEEAASTDTDYTTVKGNGSLSYKNPDSLKLMIPPTVYIDEDLTASAFSDEIKRDPNTGLKTQTEKQITSLVVGREKYINMKYIKDLPNILYFNDSSIADLYFKLEDVNMVRKEIAKPDKTTINDMIKMNVVFTKTMKVKFKPSDNELPIRKILIAHINDLATVFERKELSKKKPYVYTDNDITIINDILKLFSFENRFVYKDIESVDLQGEGISASAQVKPEENTAAAEMKSKLTAIDKPTEDDYTTWMKSSLKVLTKYGVENKFFLNILNYYIEYNKLENENYNSDDITENINLYQLLRIIANTNIKTTIVDINAETYVNNFQVGLNAVGVDLLKTLKTILLTLNHAVFSDKDDIDLLTYCLLRSYNLNDTNNATKLEQYVTIREKVKAIEDLEATYAIQPTHTPESRSQHQAELEKKNSEIKDLKAVIKKMPRVFFYKDIADKADKAKAPPSDDGYPLTKEGAEPNLLKIFNNDLTTGVIFLLDKLHSFYYLSKFFGLNILTDMTKIILAYQELFNFMQYEFNPTAGKATLAFAPGWGFFRNFCFFQADRELAQKLNTEKGRKVKEGKMDILVPKLMRLKLELFNLIEEPLQTLINNAQNPERGLFYKPNINYEGEKLFFFRSKIRPFNASWMGNKACGKEWSFYSLIGKYLSKDTDAKKRKELQDLVRGKLADSGMTLCRYLLIHAKSVGVLEGTDDRLLLRDFAPTLNNEISQRVDEALNRGQFEEAIEETRAEGTAFQDTLLRQTVAKGKPDRTQDLLSAYTNFFENSQSPVAASKRPEDLDELIEYMFRRDIDINLMENPKREEVENGKRDYLKRALVTPIDKILEDKYAEIRALTAGDSKTASLEKLYNFVLAYKNDKYLGADGGPFKLEQIKSDVNSSIQREPKPKPEQEQQPTITTDLPPEYEAMNFEELNKAYNAKLGEPQLDFSLLKAMSAKMYYLKTKTSKPAPAQQRGGSAEPAELRKRPLAAEIHWFDKKNTMGEDALRVNPESWFRSVELTELQDLNPITGSQRIFFNSFWALLPWTGGYGDDVYYGDVAFAEVFSKDTLDLEDPPPGESWASVVAYYVIMALAIAAVMFLGVGLIGAGVALYTSGAAAVAASGAAVGSITAAGAAGATSATAAAAAVGLTSAAAAAAAATAGTAAGGAAAAVAGVGVVLGGAIVAGAEGAALGAAALAVGEVGGIATAVVVNTALGIAAVDAGITYYGKINNAIGQLDTGKRAEAVDSLTLLYGITEMRPVSSRKVAPLETYWQNNFIKIFDANYKAVQNNTIKGIPWVRYRSDLTLATVGSSFDSYINLKEVVNTIKTAPKKENFVNYYMDPSFIEAAMKQYPSNTPVDKLPDYNTYKENREKFILDRAQKTKAKEKSGK